MVKAIFDVQRGGNKSSLQFLPGLKLACSAGNMPFTVRDILSNTKCGNAIGQGLARGYSWRSNPKRYFGAVYLKESFITAIIGLCVSKQAYKMSINIRIHFASDWVLGEMV